MGCSPRFRTAEGRGGRTPSSPFKRSNERSSASLRYAAWERTRKPVRLLSKTADVDEGYAFESGTLLQGALGLVPAQPSNFKRPAARRFIDSPSRVQRRTLSHHRHINNRCPVTEGHKALA